MNNADMPAMPATTGDGVTGLRTTSGFSKRELFSIEAMQSLIGVVSFSVNPQPGLTKAVAQRAVDYADALLAQLSKEPQA